MIDLYFDNVEKTAQTCQPSGAAKHPQDRRLDFRSLGNDLQNSTNDIQNNNTCVCPVKVGQKVYWDDPDHGLCSGFFQVDYIPEDWEPDSPILISDDNSEAEVTVDELWIAATDSLPAD